MSGGMDPDLEMDLRINLHRWPQKMHLVAGQNGQLELVFGLNDTNERRVRVPANMEIPLLKLISV